MTRNFQDIQAYALARIIYVLVWVIVWIFPILIILYEYLSGQSAVMEWHKVYYSWRCIWPYFLLFLVNDLILIPYLFRKGKRAWYVFAAVAAIAVTFFLLPEHVGPPRPPEGGGPRGPFKAPPPGVIPFLRPSVWIGILNIVLSVALVAVNLAISLYVDSVEAAKKFLELQNKQTQSELKMLKYQINPHFLMNTLNNIQALVDIDPERAQEVVQMLSRMLRYMLYEANNARVPLNKEVAFMENFMALMRIRYPEQVVISSSFPDNDTSYEIPPLLFISFIENAFKHGVDYDAESMISVDMYIEDGKLLFRCLNTAHPHRSENGDEGGIGLANIKQRLDLIYGRNYNLKISQPDGHYLVEMEIPLAK